MPPATGARSLSCPAPPRGLRCVPPESNPHRSRQGVQEQRVGFVPRAMLIANVLFRGAVGGKLIPQPVRAIAVLGPIPHIDDPSSQKHHGHLRDPAASGYRWPAPGPRRGSCAPRDNRAGGLSASASCPRGASRAALRGHRCRTTPDPDVRIGRPRRTPRPPAGSSPRIVLAHAPGVVERQDDVPGERLPRAMLCEHTVAGQESLR